MKSRISLLFGRYPNIHRGRALGSRFPITIGRAPTMPPSLTRALPMVLLVILVLSAWSCKTKTKKQSKTITITKTDVKNTITYLASDELRGRQTGTEDIAKAGTYIENELKSYGINPYFKTYRDHFKVKDSIDAFNIVGFLEGDDSKLKNEIVIIGAHYDHIGKGKIVEDDSIANGANDNATGTSAVLAMAKYFGAKNNNKRSLLFALFSAEEIGLLGSKHLAKKLKDKNIDLYTVVNFEMIGVPLKLGGHKVFVTGYKRSNYAEKLNEYSKSIVAGYSPLSKKYGLFFRSDNYPFYKSFNVPSHTIAACDLTNFNFYHHVDDEADKMDFQFTTDVINTLIPAVEAMANTPTKEIALYEQ